MKKSSLLLFSVLLLAFSACKKKNSPPSIIGKWAMTDISGTVIESYTTFYQQTKTITYNSAINTLTLTSTNIGSTPTVSTILINTETWELKVDGTYAINENFSVDGDPAETATSTGTWAFLSNTRANNSIIFLGSSSVLLTDITYGGAYTIELIADKLVLKMVDAHTSSTGGTQSTNVTITFKRQ